MKDKLTVENNGLCKHEDRPLLISGPCAAESEEQVVETATQLAAIAMQVGAKRAAQSTS